MSAHAPVRVAGSERSARYDAFISYAHEDRPVATGLQKGLHRVGRRMGQLHALRVFRDDTDLAAAPDLWGRVTEAMDQSRYLVVVLSPHALSSHWVNQEVNYWAERRGSSEMLLVLADGEISWDVEHWRFRPDRSNAAPEALTRSRAFTAEPLYVDVRHDAPWDPQITGFRDKVASLAAPIHGKPKYELFSDDVREQRRFRRWRRAAVIGLVVLTIAALVAATVAIGQRHEAIKQQQNAKKQARAAIQQRDEAVSLAMAARSLELANSNYAVALALAAEGAAASRDESSHALDALIRARQNFGSRAWQPMGDPLTGHTSSVWSAGFSPDGTLVATGGDDKTVRLWKSTTRTQVGRPLSTALLRCSIAGPAEAGPGVRADQMAGLSSSNAVANRNSGAASTASS